MRIKTEGQMEFEKGNLKQAFKLYQEQTKNAVHYLKSDGYIGMALIYQNKMSNAFILKKYYFRKYIFNLKESIKYRNITPANHLSLAIHYFKDLLAVSILGLFALILIISTFKEILRNLFNELPDFEQ